MPCYVNKDNGEIIDDCCLDYGRKEECLYAIKYKKREYCRYWVEPKICQHCKQVIKNDLP